MSADYSGYFLQGLAGGIQTGMNMGTQLQEMRYQKKQRKQLEETQAKMLEASNIWNAKIKEITADNTITDEEVAQLTTVFMSGGYEFMEHYSSAMNYITGMKDKEYKQELEWINLFISGIEGLPPGDIQAAYDYIKPKITSEKGLNMLEANSNMQKKKYEAMQAQPTAEVFATAGGVTEAYPGAGYEYSATAKGYVPTYQKPTAPEAPPTELDIMDETQKKLDYAYNTGNANYFNQIAKSVGVDTTFDTYKQAYEKEVGAVTPEEEPVLRTDIDYWEKTFNDVKSEDEYNRQYALLKQSKTSKQYEPKPYKEMLQSEVTAMAQELKGLLTSDNKFPKVKNSEGKLVEDEKAKATYAKYQKIYEQKVKELIAKYPDIDISQFPKYLSVEEIKKVGVLKGWFTKGIAVGDYSVIDTKGW